VGYGFEEACLVLDLDEIENGREMLDEVRGRLSQEIGGLRTLMTALRPPALDEHGLASAFQDLADDFARRTGVHCLVSVSVSQRLDQSTETVLYRVVQEALANVARHAGATNATVTLTDSGADDTVVMTVVDDGVGFDTARIPSFVPSGHFGVAGMRERVELTSGEYLLESTAGAGTRITVRMPVHLNDPQLADVREIAA